MPTRSHESFESVSSYIIYGSISANFRGGNSLQSLFCSLCSSWFCCSRQILHPTKIKFRFCCVGFGFIVCLSVCFRFSLFGCVFLCSPNRNFISSILGSTSLLRAQTGATSPSRDRRSEANSIYEIRIRLHRRGESLSRHYERGRENPTFQRRQIEGEEVLRPKITNPSPKSFLPNLTELP